MTEKSNQEETARECEDAIRQMMAEASKQGGIYLKNARTVAKAMAKKTWGEQADDHLSELISGD